MPSVNEAGPEQVAQDVMQEFLEDRVKCFPVYRADIKTEAQAESAIDLPFVCMWNEKFRGSALMGFSVTIKGSAVASMLEKRIPREHPGFVPMRNLLMEAMSKYARKLITDLCIDLRCKPSELSEKLATSIRGR